jgi:chemotaxis protein CheD
MKSFSSPASLLRYLRTGEIIFIVEPAEITTVLGSCVSVCLVDKNLTHTCISHIKAPEWNPRKPPSAIYADIAIDRQIEGMIGLGSSKKDLLAYVIGGGNVIDIPGNIGTINVKATKGILKRERIRVTYEDTGGLWGRNLVFNSAEKSVRIRRFPALSDKKLFSKIKKR